MGFSMAGVAHVSETALVIAATSGDPRSPTIWDGHHNRPEDVFLYGPGSAQHGIDPDGTRAEVLSVGFAAVEEMADTLGYHMPEWRGRQGLATPRAAQSLGTMMRVGFAELDPGGDRREALRLAVRAYSDPDERTHGPSGTRGDTDAWIISRILEHLDEKQRWFPPIAELCAVAVVSERRLRDAFVRIYGMPPSRFLRGRALSNTRQSLLEASPDAESVTHIALSHGFKHLGQFGQHYRRAFGENPSVALRSARGSAGSGPRVADRPVVTRTPG
jgi:AraC-like DNA-binding protein